MYKTVFLLLSATLALANEDASGIPVQKPSSVENVSGTNIDLQIDQYYKVVEEYDAQIDRAINASTVPDEEINIDIYLIEDIIRDFNNYLDVLRPRSFAMKCRNAHYSEMPSLQDSQRSIRECVANNSVSHLFNETIITRNSLLDHYEKYLEPEIENCSHIDSTEGYESCIQEAFSKTDALITSNRETFLQQMAVADSKAKTSYEDAFSCIAATHDDLMSSAEKVILLIQNCIVDRCKSYMNRKSCLACDSYCVGMRIAFS